MTVCAALLLLQNGPDPKAAMEAYWDRLGKAKTLYAELEIHGTDLTTTTTKLWLEKPKRMRMQMGASEVRWDGKNVWLIFPANMTYRLASASSEDVPPLFQPFFGIRAYDQARLISLSRDDGKSRAMPRPVPAVEITKKPARPEDVRIVLSYLGGSILYSKIATARISYTCWVRSMVIDDGKVDFTWPSLAGYRVIGGREGA